MPATGLSDDILAALTQVFAAYPDIERVTLYGSRAKGDFHPRSDIDLAAHGVLDALDHLAQQAKARWDDPAGRARVHAFGQHVDAERAG